MYGRAYWIFLSRGRSTPAMRAIPYPCRCLCLGLRLRMTRITPRRLITLQCSQIGLTLVRTFNAVDSGEKSDALKKNPIQSPTIDGVVSSRKGRDYGVHRTSTRRHDPPPLRNPSTSVSCRSSDVPTTTYRRSRSAYPFPAPRSCTPRSVSRSEERRVGKECRPRG